LIHKERDVNDFSDKILKLYKDEALRIELGQNGKEFIENEFSWEQTSKKLLHLYDNLDS